MGQTSSHSALKNVPESQVTQAICGQASPPHRASRAVPEPSWWDILPPVGLSQRRATCPMAVGALKPTQ